MAAVHYLLHGYVCAGGCFTPSPFEGWVTFTLIFQRRPDGCRYAIAQEVPLVQEDPMSVVCGQPEPEWICWDLQSDALVFGTPSRQRGLLPPPPVLWRSTSVDGLVMKATALYDRS